VGWEAGKLESWEAGTLAGRGMLAPPEFQFSRFPRSQGGAGHTGTLLLEGLGIKIRSSLQCLANRQVGQACEPISRSHRYEARPIT
jgi:hypothetical protein